MLHTRTNRTAGLLLGLALLMVTGLVLSLPARPASAQEKDMAEAKRQFKKGRELYRNGEHLEAAETFLKAYELSGRSELLYNIGKSYHESDELQKAEKYFQKYLNEKPNAPNADRVVELVIQIQQEIAARMATVDVQTKRSGHGVFVGKEQKPRCQTPCSISIPPGPHVISIRAEGMKEFSKSISVSRGGTKTIEATLQPNVPTGWLAIRSTDGGGAVAISGIGEKSLPIDEPLQLEAGRYELQVTGSSGGGWTGSVAVEAGETTRLLVPTGSNSGGGGGLKRSFAYGLAGASVALLAGGLVLGKNATTTHSILTDQQNHSGAVDPNLLAKGRREQVTANILLGIGTATLLSGTGLFVWDIAGD